ncbi:acetyl/propionyl/methylcrotonyl-CoA carboxylase subunit alpha [Vreelandella subglaciescola]|uniref:Biotin carboxylase n=1 Tax=Vreelandella subglaciescola TaxID=29571 RepID=A0A1M7EDG9_9GAMM|nr:acetyl/propionyl/methylcrotonyl-CoA carboxylase subunit alpha [Halomonas subglaciescola]SHL89658.1 3-methylcrotonyl-CoA carboxylase alpha subunit [Halomonas subglaciescola]
MFSKILIANRGEIACRIIQTAQRMGIRCVAVYSDADANAHHVALADEAFRIGPAPSSQSYLRAEKIIEIAKKSGAQAIHPGYGFLSENTDFAEACEANNLVFIGPPSSAIASMGSKSAAKVIMDKAGVPLVPGYHGDDQTPETLRIEAEKCGFPLLLKAVAGGGGKGMRVVESMGEFDEALAAAKREATNAFGNPDMLIERYLTQPRHVEIQVFCDQKGHGVYLAERDCSVQRRHQKVLEEAPAPGLSDETRKAMGETAVKAAQAINYVGAGTVEFLYDVDGSFFFMEMNTRLQVEHPVTEMVTGQDLVEWQLKVAWGDPLPLEQSQVRTRGHALEARIYAEDPDQDFLPATGNLRYLSTPDESAHVRVDTGVVEGDDISIHYDPMIAKLIVWDETRDQAINRMVQALEHYRIAGVKTNIRFLHALADAQPFREADLTTGFIEDHRDLLFTKSKLDTHKALVLAAGFVLEARKSRESVSTDPWSPFGRRNSWRLNSEYAQPLQFQVDGDIHELKIIERDDHYRVFVNGSVYNLTAKLEDDYLQAVINGHRISIHGNLHHDQLVLFYEGDTFQCTLYQENYTFEDMPPEGGLSAPMNGSIVTVQAKVGNTVTAGQTLVIMEAMKMEHAIKAPADGVVSEIFFSEGEQVSDGAELIAIEVTDKSAEEAG